MVKSNGCSCHKERHNTHVSALRRSGPVICFAILVNRKECLMVEALLLYALSGVQRKPPVEALFVAFILQKTKICAVDHRVMISTLRTVSLRAELQLLTCFDFVLPPSKV